MKTYKVLSDVKLENLVSSVNSAISDGFQPLGGISVSTVHLNEDYEPSQTGSESILYFQAVYKSS